MRHRNPPHDLANPRTVLGRLDAVRHDGRPCAIMLDDVVILDIAMHLARRAHAKAELHRPLIHPALTPVQEVRGLVLDIARAGAPREERQEVRDDRARV
ncbi:MAG: hypothetical protein ACSLE8_02395, partial [Rhodococcus sp. (in: high G+C Gram-positive bacteria)]